MIHEVCARWKPDLPGPVLEPCSGAAGGETYRDAKSKKEGYLAELARFDLDEGPVKLMPVNEIADALTTMGREVFKSADAIMTGRAGELLVTTKKGDLSAFRKKFQKIVRQWAEQTAIKLSDAAVDQDNSTKN